MTSNKRRIFTLCLLGAALMAAGIYAYFSTRPIQQPVNLRMATGVEGGSENSLSSLCAYYFSQSPSIAQVTLVPKFKDGSVQCLEALQPHDRPQLNAAFVMATTFMAATKSQKDSVRFLYRPYSDVLQIVVHDDLMTRVPETDESVTLQQVLAATRELKYSIYCGPNESGTFALSDLLLGKANTDRINKDNHSFSEAAKQLLLPADAVAPDDPIRIAIFAGGVRTPAVERCFHPIEGRRRATLVSLGKATIESVLKNELNADLLAPIEESGLGWTTIPTDAYYAGQPPVESVEVDVLLLCRKDLPAHAARGMLEALHTNLPHLLWRVAGETSSPARRSEIVLDTPDNIKSLKSHKGNTDFQKSLTDTSYLRIATGNPWGSYHNSGMRIKSALPHDSKVVLIPTDASLDNVKRLSEGRANVAMAQLDVALAVQYGNPATIYNTPLDTPVFEFVTNRSTGKSLWSIGESPFRRVAFLGDETLFVIARRDNGDEVDRTRTLSEYVRRLKRPAQLYCGPRESGTAVLTEAVLKHSGLVANSSYDMEYGSFDGVGRRLLSGESDVAFVVGREDGRDIAGVLGDSNLRLLSISNRVRVGLQSMWIVSKVIPNESFACQRLEDGTCDTLSTSAVLLVHKDVPHDDVYSLTKATFEGSGIDSEVLSRPSVRNLPIPLHEGSLNYYQDNGLFPVEKGMPWYVWPTVLLASVSISVAVSAGARRLLSLKRNHVANSFNRRISRKGRVPREESPRRRIKECLRAGSGLIATRVDLDDLRERRWYELRWEIDSTRWENLNVLVDRGLLHLKEVAETAAREIVARNRSGGSVESERCAVLSDLDELICDPHRHIHDETFQAVCKILEQGVDASSTEANGK